MRTLSLLLFLFVSAVARDAVELPHHCASPQKIVLETRNHRSTLTSTHFCNKIGPKATSFGHAEVSASRAKAVMTRTGRHFGV